MMQSYAESGQVVLKVPLPEESRPDGEAGLPAARYATLRITRVEELAPCDAAGILDGSSDLTGLMLWPAAEALASLIASQPDNWRGKRVLEVGAGVGLVGMVASLFCDQVLITDGEEEVVTMIEQNIQNNKEALPDVSRLRCCQLSWSEDLVEWKQKHQCETFDVILGSDIIYSFEALDPLFVVVDSLLDPSPNAYFLVLYSSRGQKLDDRLPEVAQAHGFQLELSPHSSPRAAADDEPMRLCIFTRTHG